MNSPGKISLVCLALCLAVVEIQSRQLLMIHEIFRHGARYPIYNSTKDYSGFAKDQKEAGELTLQGKHMQYILGKSMYDKYWEDLFADTPYIQKYHPSQFQVKSTNVNRTIESAESQLLGLLEPLPPSTLPIDQLDNSFPPFLGAEAYEDHPLNQSDFSVFGGKHTDFHAIPIHMVKPSKVPESASYQYSSNPYDEGDFLAKYEEENCPNQAFWSKQNMASDQATQIKNSPQVLQFLATLSSKVDTTVRYEKAYHYVDDFYCQKYMGRKHLEMFNDPDTLKTADFVLLTSTLFYYFYTEEQRQTSNSMLLQTMLYNMKQRIINKGPRIVLYSAHDTTILSFGTALNFLNIDCLMSYFYDGVDNSDTCINQFPIFATNYVIELWEEDNLSHTISISYNGVERKIPICGDKISCSLVQFETWVSEFAIGDPNKACGIHEQYLKLYIVIGVLSLLAFVLILIYLKSKYKKKLLDSLQEMDEKKGYFQQFDEKEMKDRKSDSNK